ncbi:S41 family peptidase [Taibaiella sp. KBW10]|uniref:S41 family peptidase n=1 Tax=Taibaiella sp. KBW10 TaxID=2153357 RepID=UPI0013152A50|nr:S41 family peptidase [Taibaiella sp. KBW10]
MKRILLLNLVFIIAIFGNKAHSQIPDNAEGRLWGLCKVWGYIKYYHPKTCQVNWDSLLRENITLVSTAPSNASFNNSLNNMLNFVGQIPPQLSTVAPAADSNLNLNLDWINNSNFSTTVQNFLQTFKSRAGKNDSLACRIIFNDYTDYDYTSYLDLRYDEPNFIPDYTLEKDRLALTFYYWNTFNYFGPYRKLNDVSWDTVLKHTITDMRTATGNLDYTLAFAKMQSNIDDAHASFSSVSLSDYLGRGALGAQFRWYENKIVVYKVYPGTTGFQVGDEIVKIDGENIADIAARYRNIIAASNEATFYRNLSVFLVRRAYNSAVNFEFRNASGQLYTHLMQYNLEGATWNAWKEASDGPAWKTVCNGYGYVDMGKLTISQCAQMYEEFKTKPGIILDCRNYPKGTFPTLARYFLQQPTMSARYFNPDIKAPGLFTVHTDLNNHGTWNNPAPYSGKLYLIVNQETQSHGEYTVQYLSNAANAKVIGTQTAGADGNVNYVNLPNATQLYFTGLGWYYDDWYQCQRNGLKIDTIVSPTIQGLREGRDELLERITGCTTSMKPVASTIQLLELMPNPVHQELALSLLSSGRSTVKIVINDLSGGLRLSREEHALPGDNIWKINVESLSPGLYFLQVTAADGSRSTRKFVKQS